MRVLGIARDAADNLRQSVLDDSHRGQAQSWRMTRPGDVLESFVAASCATTPTRSPPASPKTMRTKRPHVAARSLRGRDEARASRRRTWMRPTSGSGSKGLPGLRFTRRLGLPRGIGRRDRHPSDHLSAASGAGLAFDDRGARAQGPVGWAGRSTAMSGSAVRPVQLGGRRAEGDSDGDCN